MRGEHFHLSTFRIESKENARKRIRTFEGTKPTDFESVAFDHFAILA